MDEKLKRYLTLATESNPVWLAHDQIAYIRRDDSGTNIWQLNLQTGERTKRTSRDTRVWAIAALPSTGDLFYALDENGHECEQFYRLKPAAAEAERLTDAPDVRHFWGGVTPDGQTIAYACNRRTPETFDIWTKDLVSGDETLVAEHSDNYNWPATGGLSPDGRYLLYNKLRGESDNALWLTDLEAKKSWRVPADDRISAETGPAWRHDGQGFYLLTDRDGEFNSVCYYDMASKTMESVFRYGWDAASLAVSADDRYLAVLVNEDGYTALHIHDLVTGGEVNTIKPPRGVLSDYQHAVWSPEGHRLAFTLTSGTRPEALWLLDLDTDDMRRLSRDEITVSERAAFVEPILCRFASFDGLEVPYWLYVPAGKEANALPVVVDIHGGPEGQEMPSFNAFIQYLLGEGFAVAAPNVRGSTGYGKTYTHLDDVEKRLDSIRDIESLVAHLIETGTADADRIAVTGVSYGGFMTLSCAARLPDLWACAIATVGMYNLVTFLENTAEYRRAHRESEYGSLERDRELLRQVSPVAKIDQIVCPMMIVQGKNDPRVPVTGAEQAVEALRDRNREVAYLCYEDEGHGIAKLKNRLDCYPKMADFLKKHLL